LTIELKSGGLGNEDIVSEPALPKRKPTYLEVARLAKVSPSTVTRVVCGSPGVSKEMQARVRRAAQALGVDVERKKRARIISFLLSNRDVLHPFQARILVGAEAYCASQGWEMLFFGFRYPLGAGHKEIHLPQILARRDTVRGVILGGTNSAELLLSLKERDIPFAVLGNNVVGDWQPGEYNVVSSDDVSGSLELTSSLIAQGHRHIWYIGDLRLPWYAHCAEGYRRAMTAAGLEPRIREVRASDRELGYLAAKSILAQPPVTAVFAGNDQVAVGVYRAFGEAGIVIPGDISVVGFNDTEGEILYPRLTTVREFPEELGRHLAELVLRCISVPDAEAQQVMLPTQLIRRESWYPLSPNETVSRPGNTALTEKPL
jgi:LacI family transcriptional regulator